MVDILLASYDNNLHDFVKYDIDIASAAGQLDGFFILCLHWRESRL